MLIAPLKDEWTPFNQKLEVKFHFAYLKKKFDFFN